MNRQKSAANGRTARQNVTIKDVAGRCGVSAMTVSRFVNGNGFVSKEAAEKIGKAMEDLNYTPNLVAKSLRMNKTLTFGMVASNSTEFLFNQMTKGVVDAAAAADYSVIIANTNRSLELERKSIAMLLSKRIDGLLLCAPFELRQEQIAEIRDMGIPVALLMRAADFPVDFVTSDNFAGGRDIILHLASKGVDDVGFINMQHNHPNGEERRVAHKRTMLELGLKYDSRSQIFIEPSIENGYMAMRKMLRSGRRHQAIVCGCDSIAIGAVKAALEAGLRVPEDVRICGYDDIELLEHLRVPLTTIRQDVYEMGREGVRILLQRQSDAGQKEFVPIQKRLPCTLVVRESA